MYSIVYCLLWMLRQYSDVLCSSTKDQSMQELLKQKEILAALVNEMSWNSLDFFFKTKPETLFFCPQFLEASHDQDLLVHYITG